MNYLYSNYLKIRTTEVTKMGTFTLVKNVKRIFQKNMNLEVKKRFFSDKRSRPTLTTGYISNSG